jgi:Effector Associated Constant Component 1
VELRISLASGGLADLESLHDWLCDESALGGRVRAMGTEPRTGELGTLMDALIVAVSSGGSISILAASLKAWLSLPRRSDVRILIHRADGNSVEIDAKRVDSGELDVREMIRQALAYGADSGSLTPGPTIAGQQHQALDSNVTKE